MGQSFIACDREQSFLMPSDVREWLPENHLAWFVLAAVEEMGLEGFYAAYRRDGRSRPAYEPAMMVALLLYAYARGIRSWRRSSGPITRRSRGSSSATSRRWRAFSVRC
jgi:transposase